MNNIEKLQKEYNQFLDENQFNGLPDNLYHSMNYIMSLGGKRVRPLLSMIGNQMSQGDPEYGIQIGHVMEVFHNFSLVHDDIMDKAELRRGKDTVHVKWNMPTAILAGDNMLIVAFELLQNYQGPNKTAIIETFIQTAKEVCEGQQNDMDFENATTVEIDQYLKMIQFKTAVLLGCSLKCGALSGNCDLESSNILYDFAVNMGMAFQMMDDYLDTFGNSEITGKLQGGDILQGKKTWLFLMSKKISTDMHNQLFSIENSHNKALSVIEHWKSIGLDQMCLELINTYNNKALKDLSILKDNGIDCQILEELLNFLGNRTA